MNKDEILSVTSLWVDQSTRVAHWSAEVNNPAPTTAPYEISIPMHPNDLEVSRTWDVFASIGTTGFDASGVDVITFSGDLPGRGRISIRGQSILAEPTSNPFSVSLVASAVLDDLPYSAFETFLLGDGGESGVDRVKGFPNPEEIRRRFFDVVPHEDQYALDLVSNGALRFATMIQLIGQTPSSGTFDPDEATIKVSLAGKAYVDFVTVLNSVWGEPLVMSAVGRAQSLIGWDPLTEESTLVYTAGEETEWTAYASQGVALTGVVDNNIYSIDNGWIEGQLRLSITNSGTSGEVIQVTLPTEAVGNYGVIGGWYLDATTDRCGVVRRIDTATAELVLDGGWSGVQAVNGNVLHVTFRYRVGA